EAILIRINGRMAEAGWGSLGILERDRSRAAGRFEASVPPQGIYLQSMVEAVKKLKRYLVQAASQLSPSYPSLSKDLGDKERIFHSPRMTRELAFAIYRLAPQMRLSTSEKSRKYWEREQNLGCWME